MALVECVPNFSEGRDPKVVEAIAAAIRAEGVRVLDVERDADHHRCVITFLGSPEACVRAAFAGAKVAVERIDLNRHKGEHPRVGAVDVVPFIPVADTTMEECVQLARRLGERLWKELRVPVYFYEAAATRDDRKNLEQIRKGQYELLKDEVRTKPERRPDLGDAALHPTAGATVVGARGPLIAYNINLATADLALAERIAKQIRASGGGFPAVKAKGFNIAEKGHVQVSMNLTDFRTTAMWKVFDAVHAEAAKAGVEVLGSEIVGLVPLEALLDVAAHAVKLQGFQPHAQVLELRMWER
ncbi:MAG TPA: glutamate formimidoyltransferase [Candidatus Thermoplasmatota archaeon]|jgi:glutamate formiminotransferase|nr:glutamate formimidoyltransferase [Candidatus Thermoplasmatota archaeon]